MSAEQGEISFFAEPLGTVRSSLAEQVEGCVEFLGHHALVLRVVIADDKVPLQQGQHVNGPAIIKAESQLRHQLGQRIYHTSNSQALLSPAQRAIAVFNQSPPLQRTHRSLTLRAPRRAVVGISAHGSCRTASRPDSACLRRRRSEAQLTNQPDSEL